MKISIFLICACTLTAVEQTPGTFTATGSMITPRGEHSATLLQDGRVLIAGGANYGSDGFRLLASAELYDPATGTFSLTGSMTTARSGHTATLLPDGRVLITGGDPAGPKGEVRKSTAELYDPSTGLFTATGNMATGHGYSTATLLANGKVLINGGTAELYDPSTGAFTLTGPNAGSVGSTSTLLPDGRVLFAPGSEIYDPLTDKLSPTGSMVGSYFTDRTAALLTSGKVLIAGGEWDFGRVKDAELFDATTGAFTSTGDMTEPRSEHVAVLLPNGTVLITGGEGWGIGDFFGGKNVCCGFLGSLASTEIYDSSTGTFTATGDMSARREWHTSTVLNNGKVLITGGLSYGGIGIFYGSLASAELYTPPALVPAAVLLSLSGDGKGQGAIQHANTVRIASASDPAVAGEYLSIYLTGLADGSVIPPQVSIGGRLAEITFFGNVPGYPGLNVINVRMPGGVAPGPAVSVRLTYLGRTSNQVTIGAQ